uniref:Uncharacterized protein n=1 Tax=Knipowitschia caucasica TaxID=637954 RepID=A0AAV2LKN1_KNICA
MTQSGHRGRSLTRAHGEVYVEFDDQEWEKREWVKVYEDFQLFLLEHQLVWTKRKDTRTGPGAGGTAGGVLQGTKAKHIQWPALDKADGRVFASRLVKWRPAHRHRAVKANPSYISVRAQTESGAALRAPCPAAVHVGRCQTLGSSHRGQCDPNVTATQALTVKIH